MEEAHASFIFVGDLVNPSYVTKILEITPSSQREKGEPMPKHPNISNPTNYWGIDSTLPVSKSLADHLEHLLDLIENHAHGITELRNQGYKPTFYCMYSLYRLTGGISLNATIMERISRIGASLDIAIYDMNEQSSWIVSDDQSS